MRAEVSRKVRRQIIERASGRCEACEATPLRPWWRAYGCQRKIDLPRLSRRKIGDRYPPHPQGRSGPRQIDRRHRSQAEDQIRRVSGIAEARAPS
jgi:hypothetical protein